MAKILVIIVAVVALFWGKCIIDSGDSQTFLSKEEQHLIMSTSPLRSAAVIGGSGQVGRHVISTLLARAETERILLINRRKLTEYEANPKVEQLLLPEFSEENLKNLAPKLANIDAAFVTLGVGQPSKTTVEELTRVDFTLPKAFGESCAAAHVRLVSLLTSVGSNKDLQYSSITRTAAGGGLYLGLKGRIEEVYKSLNFPSLHIIRPATIAGNANTGNFFSWFAPKFDCVLPEKYRSINVAELGAAMVNAAVKELSSPPAATPSVSVFEGEVLFQLKPSRLNAAAAAAEK